MVVDGGLTLEPYRQNLLPNHRLQPTVRCAGRPEPERQVAHSLPE